MLCLVVWRLSLAIAIISSLKQPHSLERDIKSSADGVQLPTVPGSLKRSHNAILSKTLLDCTRTCTCTGVGARHCYWVTPTLKSVQLRNERYNNSYCSHSRSPVDSILDAVLTVSPNRQYLGIFMPTTPATHAPE